MSSLAQNGTAEPVSLDQILRREREKGKMCVFPVQLAMSRLLFPVDPYSADSAAKNSFLHISHAGKICYHLGVSRLSFPPLCLTLVFDLLTVFSCKSYATSPSLPLVLLTFATCISIRPRSVLPQLRYCVVRIQRYRGIWG